jgi:hypothetical protein
MLPVIQEHMRVGYDAENIIEGLVKSRGRFCSAPQINQVFGNSLALALIGVHGVAVVHRRTTATMSSIRPP